MYRIQFFQMQLAECTTGCSFFYIAIIKSFNEPLEPLEYAIDEILLPEAV